MAGFRELLAVEWDDNAVETLRLNFPHLDVYHGDIAKLSVEDVLRRTGLEPGHLDVFDGSPPCQGFSTAGKRDMGDERNQLFREYVRLLRGLRPKCFVMENVSGMVKGKMKRIFVEILRELKASGYRVSARILNAKHYGVPQSRERMIFVGVREDLGIEPSHPVGSVNVYSVSDAGVGVVSDKAEIQRLLEGGLRYEAYKIWDSLLPGQSGRFGDHYKIDPKRPAHSVLKATGKINFRSVMHCSEKRRPSSAELKRIGSFPDCYQFIGGFEYAGERIGNSVPPLLMRSVTRHIRENILSPRLL